MIISDFHPHVLLFLLFCSSSFQELHIFLTAVVSGYLHHPFFFFFFFQRHTNYLCKRNCWLNLDALKLNYWTLLLMAFLRDKLQIFFLNQSSYATVGTIFPSCSLLRVLRSQHVFLWLLSFIFRTQTAQKKLHRTPVDIRWKAEVWET